MTVFATWRRHTCRPTSIGNHPVLPDCRNRLDRLVTAAATADAQVVKIQTSLDATIKELNVVRDRNNKLEVDRQDLTITRERALQGGAMA